MSRVTSAARVAAVAAVGWVAAGGTSCASLDGFLYSPTPAASYALADPPGWPAERHVPEDHREQLELRAPDTGAPVFAVVAWRPAPEAARAPTVVYHHGNADNIDYYWARVSRIWALGANVVVYDYPGYGRTPGTPTEAGVYAAARATLAYVRGLGDRIDQAGVYLYGYSLGCAPATQLATEAPSAGLILEAPFTSVAALAADGGLVVPRSFVMTNRFDNLGKIRRAAAATTHGVVVFHGADDDFVQTRYGRELDAAVAAAPPAGPHALHVIPDANHGDLPDVAGDAYTVPLRRFLQDGAL